jgi:hypothetical protein
LSPYNAAEGRLQGQDPQRISREWDVDEVSLEMPDLYKMIETCTREVTRDEFELIEKSFPVLLQEVYDHGRITEEIFDRLGFQQDINMFGEEAPSVAEITNEPCQ